MRKSFLIDTMWLLWVAVFVVVAALAVTAFSLSTPVALADGYSLVLQDANDNDVAVEPDSVKTVDGTDVYTITYRDGMMVRPVLMAGGTPVAGQTVKGDVTEFSKAGEYYVTIWATVGTEIIQRVYGVVVRPAVLTVEWQKDSMSGEYGQDANPAVEWMRGSFTTNWAAIKAADDTATHAFLSVGNEYASSNLDEYLWEYGKLGTDNGVGRNQVKLQLVATNYVLDAVPADFLEQLQSKGTLTTDTKSPYTLTPFSGYIEVTGNANQAVDYAEGGVDLLNVFKPEIRYDLGGSTARYGIVAEVQSGEVEDNKVYKVGKYTVTFRFSGDANFFSHYQCEQVCYLEVKASDTTVVKKGSLEIEFDPTAIEQQENEQRWNKNKLDQLVYDTLIVGEKIVVQSATGGKNYVPAKEEISFAYASKRSLFNSGDYVAGWTPPGNFVGDVAIRVRFEGNGQYNAPSGDDYYSLFTFAITACDVSAGVSFSFRDSDYSGYRQYKYLKNDDVIVGMQFNVSIPAVKAYKEVRDTSKEFLVYERYVGELWEEIEGEQVRVDQDGWLVVDRSQPLVPGEYHARFLVVSDLYVCDQVSPAFTIRRVNLSASDVVMGVDTFVYGEEINPAFAIGEAALAQYQHVPEEGAWTFVVGKGGRCSVGDYDVTVYLGDPVYQLDESGILLEKALRVTPRSVAVTLQEISRAYGAEWYPNGMRKDVDVTWNQDAVLEDDVASFLAAIKVSVRFGGTDYDAPDPALVPLAGGYTIRAALSENADGNYVLDEENSKTGKLVVTKCEVSVEIIDIDKTVYEGSEPSHKFKLQNVPFDQADSVKEHVKLVYTNASGTVDEDVLSKGVYTLSAEGDETVRDKYVFKVAGVAKVTVRGLSLDSGNSDFVIKGSFRADSNVTVKTVDAGKYQSVVKDVDGLKGYAVYAAYEVDGNATLLQGAGSLTVTLPCPSTGKVTVAYHAGNEWKTLVVTRVGDSLTVEQGALGDVYVVCYKKEFNWLVLGIVLGVLVLGGAAAAVVVLARKKKKEGALAEQAASNTMAPSITSVGKHSEEEELDEFIDNFDESMVERELTPAEKIALREKEERYAQYRARLARLRGSDRTMTDTLAQLGLDKNADDEEIIERMIAEDEERARKLQEELDREAEEKRKAEEAPTMVILDHSSETLEQQTYVPTQKDFDDIDDIDV